MLKALFTSASGMKAQQMCIDTIANNLANVNTNGFKRTQLTFQDLLYNDAVEPGSEVADGMHNPSGLQVGTGVEVAATTRIFKQGDLEETGRDLDLCINGRGFLAIQQPDGTTTYTRDGSLNMDANRRLVTVDGKPLAANITIPADAKTISISTDGRVYVTRPGSTASSQVGEIQVVNFPNPAGLKAIGGNLFEETAASGVPSQHTPGHDGMGEIRSGYLERSNVEVVGELVRLITAQRAYEISTRAIRVSDDMLRNTNQIVG